MVFPLEFCSQTDNRPAGRISSSTCTKKMQQQQFILNHFVAIWSDTKKISLHHFIKQEHFHFQVQKMINQRPASQWHTSVQFFYFSSQVCCTLQYKIESSKIRRLQKMHFKAPLLATVYCCTRRTVCPCCIDFKIREVHTAQMHLGVISMKLTHAHVYKCNACSRLDGTREGGRSLRMVVHTYLHVYLLIF